MRSGKEIVNNATLPQGTLILRGHYRLLHLLHRRPRVNLYLAQRLSPSYPHDDRPLVAIRELAFTGLAPSLRTTIEQAAFEEFVSPAMLGSLRPPGAADRMYTEGDRHYLIMQLRHTRGLQPAYATTLANLLNYPQWPSWLDTSTAVTWGISLARLVTRLHRLGVVPGDLDPATILVDRNGAATWAPVLLIFWPPAPQFWPQLPSSHAPAELYSQLFPVGQADLTNPFIAPELFCGLHDERPDIYSLGAILYLLLTHYAPASASYRLGLLPAPSCVSTHHTNSHRSVSLSEHMELISPHHLNKHIPQALESIVLRTLALDSDERYPSVFELVEALEALL